MIAVDTSALMAIVFDEPGAGACIAVLKTEGNVLISAGSVAESLIVSTRRNVAAGPRGTDSWIRFPGCLRDTRLRPAYRPGLPEWGKGVHPAGLNFGDCFAYEVAKTQGCPLLYVGDGDDFAKTDIGSVL